MTTTDIHSTLTTTCPAWCETHSLIAACVEHRSGQHRWGRKGTANLLQIDGEPAGLCISTGEALFDVENVTPDAMVGLADAVRLLAEGVSR